MPRAKDLKELLAGTDPHCRRRGNTIAEFAKREAQLTAADEIEKLLIEETDPVPLIASWILATREEAALAAAEYEKR